MCQVSHVRLTKLCFLKLKIVINNLLRLHAVIFFFTSLPSKQPAPPDWSMQQSIGHWGTKSAFSWSVHRAWLKNRMVGQLSDWGCHIHTINEIVVETILCTKWEACWIFLWGSQMSKSNLEIEILILLLLLKTYFFLIFSMLQPLEIKFIKNKNLLILVGSYILPYSRSD